MALNFVVEHCELPADVMEKITNIRNSYQKKAEYKPTGERKPTEAQKANEQIKVDIVDFMEVGQKYLLVDIMNNVPSIVANETITSNKIAQLMRQLKESGKVIREEIKRKAYYSLA